MYLSLRGGRPAVSDDAADGNRSPWSGVLVRNVLALGFCSFFTDISSEMVLAVIPLFLTAELGFSVLGFGAFEAGYQAVSAVARLAGGTLGDRRQSHKRVAASGYALSAATRVGLVASALTSISAVPFLLFDRLGKGIRTAPRDALISLSVPERQLATAFGVHRTLDTAGALLGPIVAFAVLSAAPGAFDAVFVVSAIVAVIGVMVITVFAQEKAPKIAERVRTASVASHWRTVIRSPGVPRLTAVATALSAFTISDAFVFLLIQRRSDMDARWFPLLFAGAALAYLVAAVPLGRVADRLGRIRVWLAGHVLLLAMALVLLVTEIGPLSVIVVLGLLGLFYAATDGVLPAAVSRLVTEEVRGAGIAFVTVLTALGRVVSAIAFGLLWNEFGHTVAVMFFAIGLASVVAVAWIGGALRAHAPQVHGS